MFSNKPVTLFIQCIIDGLYPEVGEALVAVLSRLGLKMDYPSDQTCCGQPAFNSGYHQEAQSAARHFIRTFENAAVIVCPSGSCVTMVRKHYPELFATDSEWYDKAKAVAAKTYEFSEYLVDVLEIDDVGAKYTGRITYHDSCHLLRGIGVGEQPRKLIEQVSGIDFVEMVDSDRCCGFGGAFAVKYPEISNAMLENKIFNIETTRADAVVGCDMGCLMHIQGALSRKGSHIKTMHLAELLAGPDTL